MISQKAIQAEANQFKEELEALGEFNKQAIQAQLDLALNGQISLDDDELEIEIAACKLLLSQMA